MRKAFDHLYLQRVIPGLAERSLELTKGTAVLREWPQALEHRARIREIGVGLLETCSHGGRAGDGGIQQRKGVGVRQVAEPVCRQNRRAHRIVVDQIADGCIVKALAASVRNPNADVADVSRFHNQISHHFALQGDVPLQHAGRPPHVLIHYGGSALDAAACHYVQARIVTCAEKRVLVEHQWIRKNASRNIVSGGRNGDRVKACAGRRRIG